MKKGFIFIGKKQPNAAQNSAARVKRKPREMGGRKERKIMGFGLELVHGFGEKSKAAWANFSSPSAAAVGCRNEGE